MNIRHGALTAWRGASFTLTLQKQDCAADVGTSKIIKVFFHHQILDLALLLTLGGGC